MYEYLFNFKNLDIDQELNLKFLMLMTESIEVCINSTFQISSRAR